MPAEVNVALAGVALFASFARFKAPMAMFSDERTPSRPFGPWDLSAMIETARKRRDMQEAVRERPRVIEMSVHLCDIAVVTFEDVRADHLLELKC